MKRDSRNSQTDNQVMKGRLYLIGSILAIGVVAFFITLLVYGNKVNKEASLSKMNTNKITDLISNTTENTTNKQEESEEASTPIGKTVEQSKEEEKIAVNTSNMENTVKEEETTKKEENKPKETKKETPKETDTKKEEVKDPSFVFPVDGEIGKEYAKDTLVYSQTLGEWVTHAGIDIKAESTTIVKAAANGKVKAIKNDPRYGLTVILEHDNGFTSVYANLLTAEFVVEGETVKQGQTIGTVGNTATFEIADESHLHFEILKDGNSIDPSIYLK